LVEAGQLVYGAAESKSEHAQRSHALAASLTQLRAEKIKFSRRRPGKSMRLPHTAAFNLDKNKGTTLEKE
jgi:hypothetical protein